MDAVFASRRAHSVEEAVTGPAADGAEVVRGAEEGTSRSRGSGVRQLGAKAVVRQRPPPENLPEGRRFPEPDLGLATRQVSATGDAAMQMIGKR